MTPVVRWAAARDVELRAPFTAGERRRAAAFRLAADRTAYLAAHALVRECAGAVLGADAAGLVLRQACPECGGDDHGRPYVEGSDVAVSLSHTRGYVAAAAGRGAVGVDVEPVDGRERVPDLVLAPAERAGDAAARLTWWVLKECLVKVGVATLDGLAGVDLSAVPAAGADAWEGEWRGWTLRTEPVAGGAAVLGVVWRG